MIVTAIVPRQTDCVTVIARRPHINLNLLCTMTTYKEGECFQSGPYEGRHSRVVVYITVQMPKYQSVA